MAKHRYEVRVKLIINVEARSRKDAIQEAARCLGWNALSEEEIERVTDQTDGWKVVEREK